MFRIRDGITQWGNNDKARSCRYIGISFTHLYADRQLSNSGVNVLKGIDFGRTHTLKKRLIRYQFSMTLLLFCVRIGCVFDWWTVLQPDLFLLVFLLWH